MSSYHWYQLQGGKDVWRVTPSELKEKVVAESNPAYMTVLAAHSQPEEGWGKEEFSKMKYSGPLYFDWDSEEVENSIPPFIEFLTRLETMGVNLKSLRLYATGGRGFHCEIPEATFMYKVPKSGTTLLPHVYREMALELATECMDMRVYTARMGRMWRMPGVERSNGKYKVPLSADQALSMTPALYESLTSAPIPEMVREAPSICSDLAALFDKGRNRIEGLAKNRAKSKGDIKVLERFKGEYPDTVLRIMSGVGIRPDKGFHQIAMQLAITANALNKGCEEFVGLCDGLCKNHSSDSPRYNSPRKRRDELRRMWEYTHDNDLYEFSAGGIKSLCVEDSDSSDLDSMKSSEGVGTVQDAETELSPDLAKEMSHAQKLIVEGVLINHKGIWKRTEEGSKPLSNVGLTDPLQLIDLATNTPIGSDVMVYVDGVAAGRQVITQSTFLTRAKLNEFCVGRHGVFNGTDNQASIVNMLLSRAAKETKGRSVYITRKEGVDIVQNPEEKRQVQREVLWVSPTGVKGSTDTTYRYMPTLGDRASYNTDLEYADMIKDTPRTREFIHAMLSINDDLVVGQIVGWFCACFHRQHYHIVSGQFPLLHPNGPAQSGKSFTIRRFMKMFYTVNTPKEFVAGGTTTQYSMKDAWVSSASIPLFIDEYKPSELRADKLDFLLMQFRNAYTQAGGGAGGVSTGAVNSSYKDITNYTFSAPTIFAAETQELQTAIVQRSIAVAFRHDSKSRHTASYNLVESNEKDAVEQPTMPQLGKLLLMRTIGSKEYGFEVFTVDKCQKVVRALEKSLRDQHGEHLQDRQTWNRAVILGGLTFLKESLQVVFKNEFDARIDELMTAVRSHNDETTELAMAEFNKVLNEFAFISRNEPADGEFGLREGYEYAVHNGYVDISIKECFVKYFAWCHRKGMKPLYPNAPSFMSSVTRSSALMTRIPVDTVLETSSGAKVFRFDLQRLIAEGVETFKSKSLG